MHQFIKTDTGALLYQLPDGTVLEVTHVELVDEEVEYSACANTLNAAVESFIKIEQLRNRTD